MRAVVRGGHLLSKTLKEIPNVYLQEVARHLPWGFDMELIVPCEDFNAAQSIVMRKNSPIDRLLAIVFDRVVIGNYFERMGDVRTAVSLSMGAIAHTKGGSLVVHNAWNDTEIMNVGDRAVIEAAINRQLERGYEGAMLRNLDAPYKNGQASARHMELVKVKPFEDSEARVTGWEEEMENTNAVVQGADGKNKRTSHKAGKVGKGTLGVLIGEDLVTGETIRCANFTQKVKDDFWGKFGASTGKVIKIPPEYQFFKYKMQRKRSTDTSNKPRHPVFLGFRHPSDIFAVSFNSTTTKLQKVKL